MVETGATTGTAVAVATTTTGVATAAGVTVTVTTTTGVVCCESEKVGAKALLPIRPQMYALSRCYWRDEVAPGTEGWWQ